MSCQEDTQNNNMILNEYKKYIQDLCCFRTLRYLVWLQFVILNPGNLNHQRHQLEWIKEFISSNSIIEKHESTQSFLGFYEATMPRWNDSLIFTRWRTDGQTNKNLLTEKTQDITKVTVKVVYWCKKHRQCWDQYGRGDTWSPDWAVLLVGRATDHPGRATLNRAVLVHVCLMTHTTSTGLLYLSC